MTEIAGKFGSGKSQICYTLCVTANMSIDKEGLGGNVIFSTTAFVVVPPSTKYESFRCRRNDKRNIVLAVPRCAA